MKKIRVALAGQPNVGKSTVFNLLTGLRQHTGNWPGKTVEKKEGNYERDNYILEITDLPGCYSLTSHSLEEVISRDFIIKEKPDVVVVIVDASSLERNFYLLAQILEFYTNVVLVLNMMDLVTQKKYKIDIKKLEETLKIPVIPMIANKETGVKDLVDKIIDVYEKNIECSPPSIDYEELEGLISNIEKRLPGDLDGYNPHWIAIKVLEGDESIRGFLEDRIDYRELENIIGDREDTAIKLANARYRWIKKVLEGSLEKPKTPVITISDRLDYIFIHPILGLPIALGILAGIFWLTYTLNDLLGGYWENIISRLGGMLEGLLFFLPEILKNFLFDGIWQGVSILLAFIPLIAIFFFFLAILEDSGYLARIAFVTDRIMHLLGLHGKAFLPLMMSYGCNVPGIMAARTLEDEKDRTLLILVDSFIPCAPRVLVSAFFASIFFPEHASLMLLSLYAISFLAVIVSGRFIRRFFLKTSLSPLIMELPLYKIPSPKIVGIYVWEKLKAFLQRAGTVIVLVSGLIWILSYLPYGNIENSILSYIGKFFLPILKPLGFSWQLVMGLIAGFVAKEASLSALATIYQVGEESLGSIIIGQITPQTAYIFMVFQLLYIPCIATVATIYKETNSKKWTLFSMVYSLIFAYLISFIIYLIIRRF